MSNLDCYTFSLSPNILNYSKINIKQNEISGFDYYNIQIERMDKINKKTSKYFVILTHEPLDIVKFNDNTTITCNNIGNEQPYFIKTSVVSKEKMCLKININLRQIVTNYIDRLLHIPDLKVYIKSDDMYYEIDKLYDTLKVCSYTRCSLMVRYCKNNERRFIDLYKDIAEELFISTDDYTYNHAGCNKIMIKDLKRDIVERCVECLSHNSSSYKNVIKRLILVDNEYYDLTHYIMENGLVKIMDNYSSIKWYCISGSSICEATPNYNFKTKETFSDKKQLVTSIFNNIVSEHRSYLLTNSSITYNQCDDSYWLGKKDIRKEAILVEPVKPNSDNILIIQTLEDENKRLSDLNKSNIEVISKLKLQLKTLEETSLKLQQELTTSDNKNKSLISEITNLNSLIKKQSDAIKKLTE